MPWIVIFLSLQVGATCENRAEVRSPENLALLYVEQRARTPCRGTRIADSVVYRRPDGSVLGTKTIRWRPNQDLPAFELAMDAPLSRVAVGYAGDTAWIDLVRKGKAERHRVVLPKGAVVDAGIDTWIVRNLRALEKGAVREVPVLVPEFHRVLSFTVRAVSPDPGRSGETRLELEPSSWFLRALSTPLVVSYDAATGDLRGFSGVSDIKGPDGKNFRVSMRYRGWLESR